MEDKIDSYLLATEGRFVDLRECKNEVLGLLLRTYIDKNNTVWFKGKDDASSLGYTKPRNAILAHVGTEYKTTFKVLLSVSEYPPESLKEHPNSVWISEPGVYSLIFSSKLETVKPFQKWLFVDVLPSIASTSPPIEGLIVLTKLVFKIENEANLHKKVVESLRRSYPNMPL